jgi:acyl-CoA thioesterase-1
MADGRDEDAPDGGIDGPPNLARGRMPVAGCTMPYPRFMKAAAPVTAVACVAFAGNVYALPTRVACIGDSITAGVGASSLSKDWVSDLGALLGPSVTIANYGVSGTTMMKQSDSSYWNTGDLPMVDTFVRNTGANASAAVIIMLGTNDSKDSATGVDNWTATAPTRYAADYNSMIDELLALTPTAQVFLALPPPAFANGYAIDGTVIASQIVPIIRGVAADRQLPIIDIQTALTGMSSLFPDGVHPNDMGHMLIATAMEEGLRTPTIPPPDGGLRDAAAPTDATVPHEGGASNDATPPNDVGTPNDAETADDAAMLGMAAPSDAGAPNDASASLGLPIGSDASSPSLDSGPAATEPRIPSEGGESASASNGSHGCSFTTAGSTGTGEVVWWLAAAIVGAIRLRRGRRSSLLRDLCR